MRENYVDVVNVLGFPKTSQFLGLIHIRHPALPPAFHISQRLVPRTLTASPREKPWRRKRRRRPTGAKNFRRKQSDKLKFEY